MKINKAISAIDSNPLYKGCWPLIAQAWKNIDNITPVAIAVGTELKAGENEVVIPFDPVEGIPDGLISQVIRFIAPAFFPEDICVLSDIDMVPLSKKYFTEQLKNIPDDSLVVMSADAYSWSEKDRYPICYIAGKGKIFQQLIGLEDTGRESIVQFIRKLHALDLGWSTDELFLGKRISEFAKEHPVVFFERNHWDNHEKLKRIDRSKWRINKSMFIRNKYIDCHLLRPVSAHQKNIKLIELYIKHKNNGLKSFLLYALFRWRLKLSGNS